MEYPGNGYPYGSYEPPVILELEEYEQSLQWRLERSAAPLLIIYHDQTFGLCGPTTISFLGLYPMMIC